MDRRNFPESPRQRLLVIGGVAVFVAALFGVIGLLDESMHWTQIAIVSGLGFCVGLLVAATCSIVHFTDKGRVPVAILTTSIALGLMKSLLMIALVRLARFHQGEPTGFVGCLVLLQVISSMPAECMMEAFGFPAARFIHRGASEEFQRLLYNAFWVPVVTSAIALVLTSLIFPAILRNNKDHFVDAL